VCVCVGQREREGDTEREEEREREREREREIAKNSAKESVFSIMASFFKSTIYQTRSAVS
jgi:hypothetical protein